MKATHIIHMGSGQVYLLCNLRAQQHPGEWFRADAKRVLDSAGHPIDEGWSPQASFGVGEGDKRYTLYELVQPRVPLLASTQAAPMLNVRPI